MSVDKDQLAILRMYGPQTYCISLGKEAKPLVDAGLLEWVPAPSWAGHRTYAITDAGRAIIQSNCRSGEG